MSPSFIETLSSGMPRLRRAAAVLAALAFAAVAPAAAQDEEAADAPSYAMQSELAPGSLLLDATYADEWLVAVGEFGHVVYSDDRGETWTQAASVPTQATLTGVTFVNEKLGFAVGHDATIIRTRDGGENWDLVYHDAESEMAFMAVYFENEERGFALGAFAFMVETQDGGEPDSWQERSLSDGLLDDYHLNKLFADKNGDLYIAAEFGVVYHSSDKGRSFDRIQTQYEGSFWGGFGMSDGSVMVFGMRGNAFRSWDKGQTWTKVDTGTDKSIAGGVQPWWRQDHSRRPSGLCRLQRRQRQELRRDHARRPPRLCGRRRRTRRPDRRLRRARCQADAGRSRKGPRSRWRADHRRIGRRQLETSGTCPQATDPGLTAGVFRLSPRATIVPFSSPCARATIQQI